MKLDANEIKILSEYRFIGNEFERSQKNRNENEYLLCLRDGHQIDRVKREDATVWEIFKSYFGCGKLAGCALSIQAIAAHLAQRDLSELNCEDPAYAAIHAIAARVLVYRKPNQELWKKLSLSIRSFCIEHVYRRFYDNGRYGRESHDSGNKCVHRALLITPKTRIGHLVAQVDQLENRRWDTHLQPTEFKRSNGNDKSEHQYIKLDAPVNEENLKGLSFLIVAHVTYPPDIIADVHSRTGYSVQFNSWSTL